MVVSLFSFSLNEQKGKAESKQGWSGSGEAAGTALLLLPEEPSLPWQQRGGAWSSCSVLLVRDSSVEGSVPLVLLCLLLCFNAFAAEKEMSLFIQEQKREKKVLLMK